jgi:hypothetical protein
MLTLTFFPQKDLTIPSYEVEIGGQKYQTDPIEIKLVTSNASVVPNGDQK